MSGLSEEDAEYLRQSCEASGVPVLVADHEELIRLADVLRGGCEVNRDRT